MVEYPKPWLLFWIAACITLGYMGYACVCKWRNWNRGTSGPPAPEEGRMRVLKIWCAEVLLQRQLFALSPFRWLVHMLIFYGFAGLVFLSLLASILKPLAFLGFDRGMSHFFLQGEGHLFVKLWGDASGLALLAGLVAALLRRLFFHAAQQDNSQADMVLLFFLLWLAISGFVLEALRVALVPDSLARYSFFARLFVSPGMYTPDQLRPWLTALWSVHAFSVLGFILYLPHSKLMHSLLAPVVIAMNALGEREREDIYWPDVKKHRATR
ncbi:MAG: respiratory nitrate reductase subunit gamma [Thermodesulfovibrionales bacterium]